MGGSATGGPGRGLILSAHLPGDTYADVLFCSVCRKASRQVRILQLYAPDDAIGAIPDSQEEEEQSGQ
ncbi:MAG TPA: hypothetical protein DCM58_04880 [Desulfovibrio sp.]|nr:hypothetical protein [Desulfovibrio sp.]